MMLHPVHERWREPVTTGRIVVWVLTWEINAVDCTVDAYAVGICDYGAASIASLLFCTLLTLHSLSFDTSRNGIRMLR